MLGRRPSKRRKIEKEEDVSSTGEKLFIGLGSNVNELISQGLDIKSLASVASTSTIMRHSETLFKQPLKQRTLQSLLEYIVNGNPDKALETLKLKPSLLLERGTVRDLAGHTFKNRTPLQAALAVEDTQLAAEIRACLIEVYGEEEAEAQWHEQFPKDWKAAEEKAWEPVFDQLETLTQAIRHAEPGDIVLDPVYKLTVREDSAFAIELAKFNALLDSKLNKIITTGKQLTPQLLLCALEIYEDHFHDYFGNNWVDPRALLFWQRVIGRIQGSLAVNYMQAYCDDLISTTHKLQSGEPQSRSLTFKVYDPVRRDSVSVLAYPLTESRLGRDFAFFGTMVGVSVGGAAGLARCAFFRSLCQLKTAGMQNLFITKTLANARQLRGLVAP